MVQDPQGMWFTGLIDEEEAAMETDEFQQLLQILSYSGVNTFAFGIKCESEISDGNSFYVNGYRYYIFSYSYDEQQTININQFTSEDFPGQELYSSVSVPDFVIPSELDKLLILNKEVNSTIVPFLCDVTEDYPNACGVDNLEDIEGFYDKLGSDISNCIIENGLNPAVELSLEEIKGILLDLQTYARENQQFEFKHGGVVHRLNSQNQLETLESPESNEAINAGLWEDNSIEMKMRLSYNTDGILQFEALGIHKNLPLAEGKTARLTDISSNLLEKSNTLLKQQQVENVNTTLNDVGANLDSEKFPDGKKVNINKDASFFKILSEAGGVGLTLLKTAEIEEPVYLSDVDNTIKGPPICTGSIEGGAMAVTDITSMVTMVHDLVTDKQARQKAKEGFKSIKEKVKDDPSLLFSILGEIALEELTGSNSQDFEDMCNNETNKGKKGHLISKTSVRTATSVLATGKFLAKLPDMAKKMALKMPKAKLWVRFKKLDKDLAEDLLNKLDELEDGGNKFLDDFIEAPDETLNKFLENPELVDSWKVLDDAGMDKTLRTDPNWLNRISRWSDEGLYLTNDGKILNNGTEVGKIVNNKLHVNYSGYGGKIVCKPNKTTTVLGRFNDKVNGGGTSVVKNSKLFKYGENHGSINLLNDPNWTWEINKQWLTNAANRKDVIRVLSDPNNVNNIWFDGIVNGKRTTFGKEVKLLEDLGYHFDQTEFKFVK